MYELHGLWPTQAFKAHLGVEEAGRGTRNPGSDEEKHKRSLCCFIAGSSVEELWRFLLYDVGCLLMRCGSGPAGQTALRVICGNNSSGISSVSSLSVQWVYSSMLIMTVCSTARSERLLLALWFAVVMKVLTPSPLVEVKTVGFISSNLQCCCIYVDSKPIQNKTQIGIHSTLQLCLILILINHQEAVIDLNSALNQCKPSLKNLSTVCSTVKKAHFCGRVSGN